MADLSHIRELSASAMSAQTTRLRLTAENLANADTPGYRRKTVSFALTSDGHDGRSRLVAGPVRLDDRPLPRIHDPSHPLADAEGYYDGSSVNAIVELADAREANRSYEANLRVFDQARQMNAAVLDLLRR